MQYKITIINSPPQQEFTPKWDILPIAKLTQLGQGVKQGIFSQTAMCYRPRVGILVRMWAFEVNPAHGESRLALALAPNPQRPEDYLSLSFEPDGTLFAYTVTDNTPPQPVDADIFSLNTFKGGDLQGEYWGAAFILPQQLLTGVFGANAYSAGESIYGNLLHSGMIDKDRVFTTLFPACTDTPDISRPDCFGAFEFIRF